MFNATPDSRYHPYDGRNRRNSAARRPHTQHNTTNNFHGDFNAYNTTNRGNNSETNNASQLSLQVDTPRGHSLFLTHYSQSSPSSYKPSLPSSLRYSLLLFQERQGYPLWSPQPDYGLPKQYTDEGVRIGDVGIVHHDQPFDFLFNITCSENDPINRRGVPSGFVPISVEELEIAHAPRHRPNNSHLIAPRHTLMGEEVAKMDLDARYQTAFEFTSLNNSDHGAILALPEGSNLRILRDQGRFRDYARKHAKQWFQYAEEIRRREFPPDRDPSLYLVTGCEKCSAWGITSFFNPQPTKLVIIPFNTANVDKGQAGGSNVYSWGYDSRCTTKCHPDADDLGWKGSPLQNQCVFLRGFKVTKKREAEVKVRDITDEGAKAEKILDILQSECITNHSASLSSGPHLPSSGWASGSRSSNGQVRDSSGSGSESLWPSGAFLEIDDRMTWERPSLYHPCDIINTFMFDVCTAYHKDSEDPERVQIAISHDDDWCSLDSPIFGGSHFIRSLVPRYNIVVDQDTVYTELIQAKNGADGQDQDTERLPTDGTAWLKVRIMDSTQPQPLDSRLSTMEIEKTIYEAATVPRAQPHQSISFPQPQFTPASIHAPPAKGILKKSGRRHSEGAAGLESTPQTSKSAFAPYLFRSWSTTATVGGSKSGDSSRKNSNGEERGRRARPPPVGSDRYGLERLSPTDIFIPDFEIGATASALSHLSLDPGSRYPDFTVPQEVRRRRSVRDSAILHPNAHKHEGKRSFGTSLSIQGYTNHGGVHSDLGHVESTQPSLSERDMALEASSTTHDATLMTHDAGHEEQRGNISHFDSDSGGFTNPSIHSSDGTSASPEPISHAAGGSVGHREPELHNDLLADQIEDQTHASTQGDPSPSTALLPTSPPVTHGPSGDPAGYGVPRSSAPISSNPSTSDVRNATVLDTSSWAVRYELSNATGQNIKGE
ncbi:hypothetical protein Moror_13544 [Moniliophthora roreri MCA 2997]|uniref:Uncharacterized protein n=1 Tax=Moniliophthora roreri (strain MCA 2997) TaxID=1381753 RepID=V2WAI5_MONRO|nr:hypothetical protein Moror_13544 [Moniliophthora roreri MCA 2997]